MTNEQRDYITHEQRYPAPWQVRQSAEGEWSQIADATGQTVPIYCGGNGLADPSRMERQIVLAINGSDLRDRLIAVQRDVLAEMRTAINDRDELIDVQRELIDQFADTGAPTLLLAPPEGGLAAMRVDDTEHVAFNLGGTIWRAQIANPDDETLDEATDDARAMLAVYTMRSAADDAAVLIQRMVQEHAQAMPAAALIGLHRAYRTLCDAGARGPVHLPWAPVPSGNVFFGVCASPANSPSPVGALHVGGAGAQVPASSVSGAGGK